MSNLRINEARFLSDFTALAAIGATGDGGVNRPALSEAHLAARAWFRARAHEAGLEVKVDGAGNHSAVLRCGPPGARTLLLGSHLDSVPNGGRFDGALGVLCALETLRVVKEAGLSLPVDLEAIEFTDEEGTLVGLLGSQALTGELTAAHLANPRGGRERLEAGMKRAGLTEAGMLGARRDPPTLTGYFEVHIEQGPRLAASGHQVGVVSGIVGINSHKLTFRGQANHAGTTPMDARRDAGQGAAAFLLSARELVLRDFPGCVVNVGQMQFRPGAYNIIPGEAEVALEYRAEDAETLDRLGLSLLGLAGLCAGNFHLELDSAEAGGCEPAPMNESCMTAIESAAKALGLSRTRLPSGAGHDAQSLARICPAGMFFIPSPNGISHHPTEFSEWADCLNAANVLLNAVVNFARGL